MAYHFYASDDLGSIKPKTAGFSFIRNPYDLYDHLNSIWCRETCAPRMQDKWSEENKTLGQCSITAFLAQDIFGGEVYGIELEDGNFHCFNLVDGLVFDLTSEQFNDQKLNYASGKLQERKKHFAREEKFRRYTYLKNRLSDKG